MDDEEDCGTTQANGPVAHAQDFVERAKVDESEMDLFADEMAILRKRGRYEDPARGAVALSELEAAARVVAWLGARRSLSTTFGWRANAVL